MALLPKSARRVGMQVANSPQWQVNIPNNPVGGSIAKLGDTVMGLGGAFVMESHRQSETEDQLEYLKFENQLYAFATERLTKDVYSVDVGEKRDQAYEMYRNVTLPAEKERLLQEKNDRVRAKGEVYYTKQQRISGEDFFNAKRAETLLQLNEQKAIRYQRASDYGITTGDHRSFFDGFVKEETGMSALSDHPEGVSSGELRGVYDERVMPLVNRYSARVVGELLQNNQFEDAKSFLGEFGQFLSQDMALSLGENVERHDRVETIISSCRDGEGQVDFSMVDQAMEQYTDYSVTQKQVMKNVILAQAEQYNKQGKIAIKQRVGNVFKQIQSCSDALTAKDMIKDLAKNVATGEELIMIGNIYHQIWGEDAKAINDLQDNAGKRLQTEKTTLNNLLVMTDLEKRFESDRESYSKISETDAYALFVGKAIHAGFDMLQESKLSSFFKEKVYAPNAEYISLKKRVMSKLDTLGIKDPRWMPLFVMEYDNAISKGKMQEKDFDLVIKNVLERKVYSKDDDGWFTDGVDSIQDMMESGIDPKTFQIHNWNEAQKDYYRLWDMDILNLTKETQLRIAMAGGVDMKTGNIHITDDVRRKYFEYKTFGVIDPTVLNTLSEQLHKWGKLTDGQLESFQSSSYESKRALIENEFRLDKKWYESSSNGFSEVQKMIKKNGGTQLPDK